MTYSISSISNRDLQLLYHYRILRQPVEFLNSVYTQTAPTVLSFGAGLPVEHNGKTMYAFTASTDTPKDKVPMIEFHGTESEWDAVAGLTDAEVSDGQVTFYSEIDHLGNMETRVYWVSSFDTIQKLLASYAEQLDELVKRVNELNTSTPEVGGSLTLTGGIPDNLVKVGDDSESLTDSGYRITGPVQSQDFINPTNDELAAMVKEIGGDILIASNVDEEHYLQDLYGSGRIKIQGSGKWYLNNVSNEVQFVSFSGDVYARNCPAVKTSGTATINQAVMINSFLVHNQGIINSLSLYLGSVAKQNSGTIHTLAAVGAGCEYYSALGSSTSEPSYNLANVEGTICSANGDIWTHGKQVSFIAGQHDDPVQPSKVRIVVSGEGS